MPDTGEHSEVNLTGLRSLQNQFGKSKTKERKIQDRHVASRQKVADLEQQLVALEGRGATKTQTTAAKSRIKSAEASEVKLGAELGSARDDVADVRNRIDDFSELAANPFSALDAKIPVALFPVRLETRFVDTELRVRVYPDVVHIDQLEPLLTADEQEYGKRYWNSRWNCSASEVAQCWDRYKKGRPANRVAWIINQTTPRNIDEIDNSLAPTFPTLQLRESGVSKTPEARLLPSKWLVVGYRAGKQVLRKWGSTIPHTLPVGVATEPEVGEPEFDDISTTSVDGPDVQDKLAIDDKARWLVDYEAAVAIGMAITIDSSDAANLRDGFDRLVVLGVDHRHDPATAAAELEQTLTAHYYTDGLGFVSAGTATNASTEATVDPKPVATDPSLPVPSVPSAASSSEMRKAFGLETESIVGRLRNAEQIHGRYAADVNTVLWEPTFGYFLRQFLTPLVSDTDVNQIRDHFRRHVRPAGPLPLLRIGQQPFGVLPITPLKNFEGGEAENKIVGVLNAIRPFWKVSPSLQLGDSDNPSADLIRLLERSSRSVAYRFGEVLPLANVINTEGRRDLAAMQRAIAEIVFAVIGVNGDDTEIAGVSIEPSRWPSFIPLVTGDEVNAQPLKRDYVKSLLKHLTSKGGYNKLTLKEPANASTLFEALLLHAADLEIVRAATGLVIDKLDLDISIVDAMTDRMVDTDKSQMTSSRTAETPRGSVKNGNDVQVVVEGESSRLNAPPAMLATSSISQVSGRKTIVDYLAAEANTDLNRSLHTRQLSEFRTSLKRLAGASTQELDDCVAGVLDTTSHRLDAWITSFGARRLNDYRSSRARPVLNTTNTLSPSGAAGVQIGGFGWVENLKPTANSGSAGFIHAPSIPHAATAAILRSGHLARGDTDGHSLEIDLSSRRTRDALKLIDGMRSAQSMSALLGYRYERQLRDQGDVFGKYVLPSRQQFPLPQVVDSDDSEDPVEEIAARNVVDGLALAELDAAGRARFLKKIDATSAHSQKIEVVLDGLVDAVDSVGDLLTSESVFQAVAGNSDRAAAALDALDRQTPIPEIGIVKTPRSAQGFSHKVLVSLDTKRAPTSWDGLADTRGKASPRVNAWLGQVLGDPDGFEFSAEVLDVEGQIVETILIVLSDLEMSPLSAVLSTARGSSESSEFEERLARAFASEATSSDAAELRIVETTDFMSFIAIAQHLNDLIASARSADVRDFAHPSEAHIATPDVAELRRRVDAVAAQLERVGVEHAQSVVSRTGAQLVSRLESSADLGLRQVLPQSDNREHLQERVLWAAKQANTRLEAAEALTAVADDASDYAAAQYEQARLGAMLGEDFPAVPEVRLPATVAAEFGAALADPATTSSRPLGVTEWLNAYSRVRVSVERLWTVLAWAEAKETDVDATQLEVAQLPHKPGEVWLGLPEAFVEGDPAADTSVVVHRTNPNADNGARAAGLVIDQWHEEVPSASETTGISFHYDGPGARAPQSMLLATHPSVNASVWSEEEMLNVVSEAAELTRMRTLDLDDIVAAGRFLPAMYLASNEANYSPNINLTEAAIAAQLAWGRENS